MSYQMTLRADVDQAFCFAGANPWHCLYVNTVKLRGADPHVDVVGNRPWQLDRNADQVLAGEIMRPSDFRQILRETEDVFVIFDENLVPPR